MVTGDAAYIKKINRCLILSKIIEHRMISRAELAKITGLNKATISVQAADLLAEGLIIETQAEHKNLGRRPIFLSINHQAGYALGIDLDKDSITFTLSELNGSPIQVDTLALYTSDYNIILDILTAHIIEYKQKCSATRYGIIGVVIGIHGVVDNDEVIFFVPQHQWRNKNLKADLQIGIGITNVTIANNANLCSFAERVFKYHQSENLLSVSLYSGIGLGMMVNGESLKGYHGYAGEIGHMIVVPDGKPCSCGNLGCWEQYASELSFVKQLAANHNKKEIKYKDIQNWLKEQEPITIHQMEQYIKFLSVGINNIINLYNPEILVINSELLRLFPNATTEIKAHLNFTVGQYRELQISEFGKKACIMGACALAIKNFLEVSELSLTFSQEMIA